MSRKGMDPSCLCSSVVNCMAESTEFMCCRNSSLLSCFKMTNVSSTNLFCHLGKFTAVIRALSSKNLHIQIGHYRAHSRPHSCPLVLLIILTLEQEIGVAQAKLQQVQDVLNGCGCSLVELCILFQLLLSNLQCRLHWDRLKRAAISYEMMYSPSSSLIFLMSSADSLELFTW